MAAVWTNKRAMWKCHGLLTVPDTKFKLLGDQTTSIYQLLQRSTLLFLEEKVIVHTFYRKCYKHLLLVVSFIIVTYISKLKLINKILDRKSWSPIF